MSVHVTLPGHELVDSCLQGYGTLDALYQLLQDNDLVFGQEVASGSPLTIEDGKYLVEQPSGPQLALVRPQAELAYTAKPGQDIVDLALQLQGDLEQMLAFLKLNQLAIGDFILPGRVVAFSSQRQRESEVAAYFLRAGKRIATDSRLGFGDFGNDFGSDFF